jgi:hypothetical protein
MTLLELELGVITCLACWTTNGFSPGVDLSSGEIVIKETCCCWWDLGEKVLSHLGGAGTFC